MGKDAMDGRLLALLAVIAIVAGAFLACWQVQYADAANTNRTLPVATIASSAYRTGNLTGAGSTSGNNILNSSQLQLQVNSHLLPALSSSTAYLLNKDSDTVSVIDVGKQKVIKHIKVGSYPVDMAWNAAKSRLYVVNMGSDSLTVIDTTTDAKTGEIDLLFPGPEHVVVSPDGKKIYVSAYNEQYSSIPVDLKRPTGSKSIMLVVDADTGRLTKVVSLPFTAGQMAISPDGSRLYVLSGTDYGVLDTNTWKVLKSPRPYVPPQSAGFAHDMGADSTCLALSPDGKWLYVTNTSRYNEIPQGYGGMPLRYHLVDLDQVDTATYQVKKTVQLTYNDTEKPHDESPWGGLGGLGGNNYVPITADGIAVSPDGWLVVVTSYIGNTYNYGTMNAFYNENTGFRWAGTYAIDTTTPEGVAFSPDGRTICLANGPDNACSLIETGMGKITTLTANPTNMLANDGAIKVVTRPGPVGSSSGGPLTISNVFGHVPTLPKKGQMPASMQAPASTETGALYICNNQDNTVSVIDLATEQVNDTIDVYKSPTRVAATPEGSRVFVIDHVLPASSLSVIDASSNTVIKTGEEPKTEYVDVLASPDGTSVYLSTNSWTGIAVLDAATGNLKRTIALPTDNKIPNHIALSPKGRYIYLTYDDRTLVYDVIDNKARGKIDYVGDGAAVFSQDGYAYVASKSLGIIVPIDQATRQPLYDRAIYVSGPGDMAVSPDGKRLYVFNTDDNSLVVANTATGAIVDVVDLASPNFPASLKSKNNSVAVSPNGTRVYVSNPAYGTVWVIDAASNYIVKSIKVGNGPEGMAIRYSDDRTYEGSPESSYLNTALSAQTVSGYSIPALKQLQVADTPITLQTSLVRTGDGSNISRLAANGFMLVPASAGGMAYYNVTTGSATGDAATVKGIRLEIGKQAPIEAGGVRVMAEATMNAVPVDSSVDLLVLAPESVDLGRVSEALNLSGTRLDGGALAAVEIDRSGLENGRDIGSATLTFQFPKPAGFDPAKRYCVVRQDGSASEVLDARYLGEGANQTVSFDAVSPHGFSTFTLVMTAAPAASATPRATASGGSGDGLWGILVVMAALGLGFVARLGRRGSGK